MSGVRVSVLLPTHNRADVLPFAVRSALWQTLEDFELLIVGDGCTDGTSRVVESFSDPRIRWFDLPKAPGIGYANRNVALRQARGDLIAYLAHDDVWMPDHLERMLAVFSAPRIEFAYSRGLSVGLDGVAIPYWFNLELPDHFDHLQQGVMSIALSSVVHRRSCFARVGLWDETLKFAGDLALWRAITTGGANFAFVAEPTIIRCVADWRRGPEERRQRIFGWMDRLAGFLLQTVPPALRFDLTGVTTEQEAIWRCLAAAPEEESRNIRRAVIQFHDALLWILRGRPARTAASVTARLHHWIRPLIPPPTYPRPR